MATQDTGRTYHRPVFAVDTPGRSIIETYALPPPDTCLVYLSRKSDDVPGDHGRPLKAIVNCDAYARLDHGSDIVWICLHTHTNHGKVFDYDMQRERKISEAQGSHKWFPLNDAFIGGNARAIREHYDGCVPNEARVDGSGVQMVDPSTSRISEVAVRAGIAEVERKAGERASR